MVKNHSLNLEGRLKAPPSVGLLCDTGKDSDEVNFSVACWPNAICILMLTVLPQEEKFIIQVISCEPCLHFSWPLTAKAYDWPVEERGGTEGLRVGVG